MSIVYDALSNATAGTGNLSWTHTPSSTPTGVIVFIIQSGSPASDQVSGVTYGGVAMTEASNAADAPQAISPISPGAQSGGSDTSIVYTYFLKNSVPTGAQPVIVTVTGSASKTAVAVTITSTGTIQIQNGFYIRDGAAVNPSAVVELYGVECFCIEAFQSGQNAVSGITPFTNWTARYEEDLGSSTTGIYTYDILGTSDVTFGWTQTSAEANCVVFAITEPTQLTTITSTAYVAVNTTITSGATVFTASPSSFIVESSPVVADIPAPVTLVSGGGGANRFSSVKLKHTCNHALSTGQYTLSTCPRCLGAGIYYDIQFDDIGQVVSVADVDKLAQDLEKIILTEANVFHANYAANLKKYIGKTRVEPLHKLYVKTLSMQSIG